MCPFILLKSDYVQVWIITMMSLSMTWLIFAFSLHRIELFAKRLSKVRVKKIQEFMEKHGKECLIALVMLGLLRRMLGYIYCYPGENCS